MASLSPVPAPDAIAYVRAALPPPPARVLEVGAGDGELAGVLTAAGYDVTAIDPRGEPPRAAGRARGPRRAAALVRRRGGDGLAAPRRCRSSDSLRRLSEVLRHGARLVVDEFAVEHLDERAAAWWLRHAGVDKDPADHVAHMREHLHSLAHIREQLAPWFDVAEPVPVRLPVPLEGRPGAARRGGDGDRGRRAPGHRLRASSRSAASASRGGGRPRPRACSRASSARTSRPRRRASARRRCRSSAPS